MLVLGFGGTHHPENQVFEVPGDATSFQIPEERWQALLPHVAWWWYVLALPRDPAKDQPQRSEKLRCVVRRLDIPRVEGSTLYQHDSGVGPSESQVVQDLRG